MVQLTVQKQKEKPDNYVEVCNIHNLIKQNMCNGQNCNCKKGASSAWLCTIVVLLLVGLGIFGFNTYKRYIEPQPVVVQEQVFEEAPLTVDQRINEWKMEVQNDYVMETYLSLPELILREVLNKTAPDATPAVIVENYDRNIRYYLSKYVQDSFKPELSGDDAKKIDRIEIKTVLKEPEKTTTSVPIVATDSLK